MTDLQPDESQEKGELDWPTTTAWPVAERVNLPHRTPWEALQRAAVVDGLRCLADFYQAHPEVPLPAYPAFTDNIIQARTDEEGAAIIKVIAAALGVEVTTTTGGGQHLQAERSFGGVLF